MNLRPWRKNAITPTLRTITLFFLPLTSVLAQALIPSGQQDTADLILVKRQNHHHDKRFHRASHCNPCRQDSCRRH